MFNIFRKKTENETENFALKLTLEFGVNFGKDISERLLLKFPNLKREEIDYYKKLSKDVESDCWNVTNSYEQQINVNQLIDLLNDKVFKKHSWINSSNQSNIISKFPYYFWKDGILK